MTQKKNRYYPTTESEGHGVQRPVADYKLEGNPGDTVFLLRPLHPEAAQNLKDHSSEETQFLGNAMAVEHRYVDDLVARLTAEGWEVE